MSGELDVENIVACISKLDGPYWPSEPITPQVLADRNWRRLRFISNNWKKWGLDGTAAGESFRFLPGIAYGHQTRSAGLSGQYPGPGHQELCLWYDEIVHSTTGTRKSRTKGRIQKRELSTIGKYLGGGIIRNLYSALRKSKSGNRRSFRTWWPLPPMGEGILQQRQGKSRVKPIWLLRENNEKKKMLWERKSKDVNSVPERVGFGGPKN